MASMVLSPDAVSRHIALARSHWVSNSFAADPSHGASCPCSQQARRDRDVCNLRILSMKPKTKALIRPVELLTNASYNSRPRRPLTLSIILGLHREGGLRMICHSFVLCRAHK